MTCMDPYVYERGEKKGFMSNLSSNIIDFIQTLVVFGAIFVIIYLFIAQPHKVSGHSMIPTFHNGDYILTDKITYRLSAPKRGDIIVLKDPKDESQDFIKRIMALPEETIKIEDGSIYINGQLLEESYLPPNTITDDGDFLIESVQVKVGPNQYFVLGDNRGASSDSRSWGGITKEEIVGRVFFRYWPPQDFGLIRF